MSEEQMDRFESMRLLIAEATNRLAELREITQADLTAVSNDDSEQAEQLQRIQQYAGDVVHAMTKTADVARHARSYQAQAHQDHTGNVPQ